MKAIVFLLLILLTSSKASGYTLPVPDNTIGEGEQQINFNNTQYTGEVYRSKLSEEKVTAFYKDALSQQGFSLITEEQMPHILHFVNLESKEHIFMLLDSSFGDETQIRVSSWQGDTTVYYEPPAEVNKDTAGSDIPGIPRYPGAIRISSTQNSEMKNACYKTTDSKGEIANFYENKMPLSGWRTALAGDIVKQKMAELSAGNQDVQDIKPLYYENKGRLLVIIITGECCGSRNNLISVLLTQENVLAD